MKQVVRSEMLVYKVKRFGDIRFDFMLYGLFSKTVTLHLFLASAIVLPAPVTFSLFHASLAFRLANAIARLYQLLFAYFYL